MKPYVLAFLCLVATAAQAGSPAVYEKSVKLGLDTAYARVYKALETRGFYVVFEPDIGANLSKMADRLGKDYNQRKLQGIKSMVFCNAGYANAVSNADPALLALCPLHVTLIHKAGMTTVLFVRPGIVAQGSPAATVAHEIEREVIQSIESGLHAK